jgi:hypothetical protein
MGLRDFFKKLHPRNLLPHVEKARKAAVGKKIPCPNCGKEVTPYELARFGGVCRECAETIRFAVAQGVTPVGIKRRGKEGRIYKETSGQMHVKSRKEDFKECPNCGLQVNITHYDKCPECGYNFKTQTAKPLAQTAGKRVGARIYEVFIFEIAGILSLFIPSFFGFPSFTYLAIALMAFMPMYILLPSEYDILRSIEIIRGETVEMERGKFVLLVPKAIAKIMAFALILYQFTLINLIVTLVLAFIFYFSMPLRYKTSRPYKMIEAWTRMGFGAYIAILFFIAFGSGNNVALSLALMAGAFFCTLPVHIEEEGNIVVKISKKVSGLTESPIEKILFGFIMFLVLPASNIIFAWTGDITQIMFIAVWALSLITGIMTGPEGRPAVGIVMIFIALFTFTSMYTGIIGQTVFGYWWPQVQSLGETYLGPLGDMWTQAQSGLSDTWMIITNPQQYYLIMQQKQQATKSVVKSGGTIKSIELNKIELFPSIPGTLEPSEPVIGNIELQNQGEFEARGIYLNLSTVWVNPEELTEEPKGNIDSLACSGTDIEFSGNPAYCNWTETTYPKEMKSVTFILKEGSWYDLGSDCEDQDGPCTCGGWDGCTSGNTTYSHSGETVKLYANLTYNYNVNVSIPFKIINSSLYLNKLQAGEIVLQDITSEYTGGPVKATLWTPKQPARTNEPYLVVASIYNDGSGSLLRINNFTITVYGKDISEVKVIASTFRTGINTDGCTPQSGDITKINDNFVVTCKNTYGDLKTGEFKRVSLYITPSDVTDETTTLIVGWANYDYLKSSSQSLTIANAPPQ